MRVTKHGRRHVLRGPPTVLRHKLRFQIKNLARETATQPAAQAIRAAGGCAVAALTLTVLGLRRTHVEQQLQRQGAVGLWPAAAVAAPVRGRWGQRRGRRGCAPLAGGVPLLAPLALSVASHAQRCRQRRPGDSPAPPDLPLPLAVHRKDILMKISVTLGWTVHLSL
ncbi:hypothetical protein RR48_02581 [Papilio machaon]|uniref:Uncharacterized protein n=1 Tax=Papilio machaon TaxID=76193 RepID=A0A0N1II01_PAPMA|nr:hypothetical protein RR48_02581 [Papilio machaon]